MADRTRTTFGTIGQGASARPATSTANEDIVKRAAAILARETSSLRERSASSSPIGTFGLARFPASLPNRSNTSSHMLDECRQRAVEAITALLATAGPAALQSMPALGFPWRAVSGSIDPGAPASVPLTIDNTEGRPITVTFYSTDLIGDSGYHIPANLISFDPSSQTIPPGSRGTTRMNVAVPIQAMAGSYSGLVQAVGFPAAKAVVTLDVL